MPEVLIIYGDLLGDGILWKDFFEVCFYEDLFPLCQTKVAYSFLNISAPMLGAALSAADVLLDSFLTGLISSCPPKL